MKPDLPAPLLLITDRAAIPGRGAAGLRAVVAAALEAGCRWILLREKDLPRPALARLAGELRPLIAAAGARLSISGDAEVAAAAAMPALHLPQGGSVAAARARLGPAALIGVSAHSLAEAVAAQRAGATYVTLSPIFASISKPGYGRADGLAGTGALAAARAALSIPIIALGGITSANCRACLAAGAAGVAVMGAVMRSRDPGAVVRDLLASLAAQGELS